LSLYREKKPCINLQISHDPFWLAHKNKWVMILFLLIDIKLMWHNQFWLDDKKTLNDMRNMKMSSVLFKRNNPNVYNRDLPNIG